MKTDVKTIIMLAAFIAGVVTSHFVGLASAKDHTDKKTKDLRTEISRTLDGIKNDLKENTKNISEQKSDIRVIRTILVQKYGNPITR